MPTEKPLLLADIGGTHTRFARIESPGAPLRDVETMDTGAFASFEAALAIYLASLGKPAPSAIAIGAAGPLAEGRIKLTNGAWTLEPVTIARGGIRSVTLMNDLAAYAAGAAAAKAVAFETVVRSARDPADILVVAVGTGIGAAIVRHRDGRAEVFPTEAGHMSFAPETEEEDLVLAAARAVHKRVTFEHVASGSGLPTVYAALAHLPAHGEGAPEDGAGVIRLAQAGDARAKMALHVAAGATATYIRALALLNGGADLIVIGGGLGLAVKASWRSAEFVARVRQAPDMPLSLGQVGIAVATDPELPLRGAADLAWGRTSCARIARYPSPGTPT